MAEHLASTFGHLVVCVYAVHAISSTHARYLWDREAAITAEPLLVPISRSVVSLLRRLSSWRENSHPRMTGTMFGNVGTISAIGISATENKRRLISFAGDLLPN